jgi:hypothetical protein
MVRRRLLTLAVGGMLLVLMTAPPALADDGGLRGYNFPKHDCAGAVPTHVDLYMHTWNNILGHRLDGRIHYYSGTCAKAAQGIQIFEITLWQLYSGRQNNVASSGNHWVDVTSGDEVWSTPDVSCDHMEPLSHVEVVYQIHWKDGSLSNIRDDNSYNWSPTGCG